MADVLLSLADKGCNRGEVRGAVAAQGHECHVIAAGALDAAVADYPEGVGKKYNLQEHRRRIGLGARDIVAVVGVEMREIQLLVQQMAQGMLKCDWKQLATQVHRQKLKARIRVLVARHAASSPVRTAILVRQAIAA